MFTYVKPFLFIEASLIIGLLAYNFALRQSVQTIVTPKVAAIVLFTPVVALFSGNVLILYAYFFVVAAFSSRNRLDLCSIYMVLVTICPMLSSELVIGNLYLLHFSTLTAIGLGAIVAFLFLGGKQAKPIRIYDLFVLALIVIVCLMRTDFEVTSQLRMFIEYALLIGVPYFILSRTIVSRNDLDRVLLHLALGSFLAGLEGVFEIAKSWPIYQSYVEALRLPVGLSATGYIRGGFLRVHGPLLNFAALGMLLATAAVLMPYLRQYFRRMHWLAISLTLLAGLAATQSRGAWVAAAAGAALIMLNRGRTALFLACAALAGGAWGAKALLSAGKTGYDEAAATAQYRADLLAHGLEQIWQHPLFGQSQRDMLVSMSDMVQGQGIVDFVNTPLWVALATGLVGLAIWLLAWGVPFLAAWGAARSRPAESYPAPLVPAAMLGVAFVTLIFTSIVDRNLLWPVIAIALVGPCLAIVRQESSRRAPAARPMEVRQRPRALQGAMPSPVVHLPR